MLLIGQNYQYPEIDSLLNNGQSEMALVEIKKLRSSDQSFSELQEVELLYHEAMVFFANGKYNESSKLLEQSLGIIKKSEDNYGLYYHVVFNYASAIRFVGDYETAIKECQLAIENLEKASTSKTHEIVRIYTKQANLYARNSQFELAEQQLNTAKQLLQSIEDDEAKIDAEKFYLQIKAAFLTRSGKIKEAIEINMNLLEIAQEEADSTKIGSYFTSIAFGYFRLGDYGKCKHYVEKSMEVNLKIHGKDSPRMLRSYGNMGVICMKLEDYDTAQEYYDKTYNIIEKTMGTENKEMASLTFNYGVSHYQKGEYDEALSKFKESLRLRRKFLGKSHADVAHATQIIGSTLLAQEKINEAIPYLEKALDIRIKLGNPSDPELTRIYSNLAVCHQKNEALEKAQTYVDAAYESIGYDNTAPFDFDKLSVPFMFANPLKHDISLAAERYKTSGLDKDYSQLLEKSVLVDSIQNYLKFYLDDPGSRMVANEKNMLVFAELMNGYYTRYSKTNDFNVLSKVFTIFEKSKNTLMFEKLAEESGEFSIGMPNEVIDRKFSLEDSIAHYQELSQTAEGNELSKILKSVNNAKSDYYAHLAKIKSEYPKFYESVYDYPIASIEEYSESLSSEEATLSYFFGNGQTYALFFKNGAYELKNCGESKVIDSLFIIFKENIEKRNQPQAYIQSSKQLYSTLINSFDISGVKHLNILVDNVLSLLPFEVLINPITDDFLLETHSISYHYSASLQMKRENSPLQKGSLLAMAPVFENQDQNNLYASVLDQDVFRSNLSALPFSEDEINSIYSIFGGMKLAKNEATESAFKKFAPDAHVLHLATHGFVNHNSPDNSRLYFHSDSNSNDDGKLHAFEIVNMDLKADLVTLSACNTGAGAIKEGEGIASIGRAFAYAGCPNQLISLWPANDKSTTTIMTNFYKNIRSGNTKAQALHNAKRQYLASSPEIFKHPYYWSGFVYYGNDDLLLIDTGLGYTWIWMLCALFLAGLAFFILKKK